MSVTSLAPLQKELAGIRREIVVDGTARIRVFSGRSMAGAQVGYAVGHDRRSLEGWPPGWVVIGQDRDGVFVAETATVDARVLHAQPSLGGWLSTRVDVTVPRFAERLRAIERFAKAVGRGADPDRFERALRTLAVELSRAGKLAKGSYWDELLDALGDQAAELATLRPAADVAPVHRFVERRLSPTLAKLGGFDGVIAGAHADTRGLLLAGVVGSWDKIEQLRRVVDDSGLTDVVWHVQVRPESRAHAGR